MIIITDLISFNKVADEWKPVLTYVDTLEDAADNINFPHEDYPIFVPTVENAISYCIQQLKNKSFGMNEIKLIHKLSMEGNQEIVLGQFRHGIVTVGKSFVSCQPYMIESLLHSILPFGLEYQKNEEDIIDWYKKFETVHPFVDGNGRVGGVLLAAISYLITGKYLVSEKEYHYTINPILKRLNDKDDIVLNKYFTGTHKEKCLKYLEDKFNNNHKVMKILSETNNIDNFRYFLKSGDLDKLIDLMKMAII
jgi:fido (protein-threonine AMPylation protein)